jgi:protein-L-isoaspartate O-methyltransferase
MPLQETSARDVMRAPAADASAVPGRPPSKAFILDCATVFVSAFLLFSIQPMMGRLILPLFGGSASVWSACMVFFQAILLAGYAYADYLARKLPPRVQGWIHAGLLVASLFVLPMHLRKPFGENVPPAFRILLILGATIGAQYFLLSSTSPLIQMWCARRQGTSPYRLYALSNLASLLALLSYPVVIEPHLTGHAQILGWSVGFGAFALMSGASALLAARQPARILSPESAAYLSPKLSARVLWVILSAIPSALLLATTNHLCQNVAAIPFLWIIPLAAYLLTLILCFDFDSARRRRVFQCLAPPTLIAMTYVSLHGSFVTDPRVLTPLFTLGLFIVCMVFHGELVARRPEGAQSSSFYLMVSLGGVLGGALIVWVAPLALRGVFELPILVTLAAGSLLFLYYRRAWWIDVVWAATSIAVLVFTMKQVQVFSQGNRVAMRNFYGALRIVDSQTADGSSIRVMVHGTVSHGTQFQDPAQSNLATTYYAPGTGVAAVLQNLPPGQAQVGIIGLGAGTLAAYARPGDQYVFYELNPQVIELARREFTFLQRPNVEVIQGDGRLALQRDPRSFDVIVVDAFSGDAIPTHLLTREAIRIYAQHLKPGGIIGIHISNSVIDLEPAVLKVAESEAMFSIVAATSGDDRAGRSPAIWALLSSSQERLHTPELDQIARPLRARPGQRPWTDDYNNLFQLLKTD